MRLKRDAPAPMAAIDQLKAGWLDGLPVDAQAHGWIFLKLHAVAEADKDAFREYLRACDRQDVAAVDLLAQLRHRQRTVGELEAAQEATGLVW